VNVYKLFGVALIRQEVSEAKDNIAKRIEFITSEM
jgi:chaperonin cofactor prefoldin